MEHRPKNNLFYNNNRRNPPILLNKSSSKFSKISNNRIMPSYSGNPLITYNTKINIYSSNNFNSINRNPVINNYEPKYEINKNINNYNNNINNSKYSHNYPKYLISSNNFHNNNNINNNKSNLNNYFSPKKILPTKKRAMIQPPNLRSRILTLTNSIPKKILTKNYSMQYIPTPPKNYSPQPPRKKLILDLDETLVHSGFNPFTRKSDISIKIDVDGKIHTVNVLKRPHVDEFLNEISKYFEVYIFTASMEEYASPVIDIIDKNKMVRGKFFRQDCIFSDGLYIKNLKKAGNDLKDIIIIDNNPGSYATNEENGIPIKTWYDDLNDNELIKLIPLLKYLSEVNDVRNIITKVVNRRNNEVDFYEVNKIIKNINPEEEKYENNFYYEINDSKKNQNIDERNKYKYLNYNSNDNNNNNIYNKQDYYSRYNKYNNINSFSNMSYNDIQSEGHNHNNNINNQRNNAGNIYQNNNNCNDPNIGRKNYYTNNNFYNINDYDQEKGGNIFRNKSFNEPRIISNKKENEIYKYKQNPSYDYKIKNIRPYTPNINRRKTNSFFDINNNNQENKFITGYKDNLYKEDANNNMNINLIKNFNINMINNRRNNTPNLLNRSSSDIYINIKKNDDNKRYNYLLNIKESPEENNDMDNFKQRKGTEANQSFSDYYLESYKNHLSRKNNRIQEYNSNLNNNINKRNINNYLNRSFNYNKSNNHSEYFDNNVNNMNNKENNNINPYANEENIEQYNYYKINNYNNNKRSDYLNDIKDFKKQMNSRFINFRNFINDRKNEIILEENKNRNIEEQAQYEPEHEIESYENKNYLGKTYFKYPYNNNNIYENYLERTNLQNLINDYRNKYNALEHSRYNNDNILLNKTVYNDTNYFNNNNNNLNSYNNIENNQKRKYDYNRYFN